MTWRAWTLSAAQTAFPSRAGGRVNEKAKSMARRRLELGDNDGITGVLAIGLCSGPAKRKV